MNKRKNNPPWLRPGMTREEVMSALERRDGVDIAAIERFIRPQDRCAQGVEGVMENSEREKCGPVDDNSPLIVRLNMTGWGYYPKDRFALDREAAAEIDRLRVALAKARNDALEEAARKAETYEFIMGAIDPTESEERFAIREAADDAQMLTANHIAAAIRALKGEKP